MYLQLDTKFNPFTYDEMVKPLIYYKQAYDEAEAAYSDLSTNTEKWRNIVDRNESPQAFESFQRYLGDLTSVVDDFSKGMNSKNRRALLGLKRRYSSDIQPIVDANTRRSALAEEQRKAELNNPTMLWERKANEMSLDDFINNPNADYGKSVSGAALTAQVAAGAGALAKEFRDNPKKMIPLVGGDYYEYIKQRGFSSEAILAAIMDNPNASPILTQLVESSIDSTGLKKWASPDTLQQAYNYARQGLWNAVGQSEAQIVQNWRAQENLSHQHAMSRQAAAQAFQARENEKNRAFQREQAKAQGGLREIVDKNGNSTNTWYDPKIGRITDKNGRIIGNADGSIPNGRAGANSQEERTKEFRKVGSVADMKKQGYTPAFVTGKFGGEWFSLKEGDDVPNTWSDYTRSNLVTNHYLPIGVDGNITFKPRRKGAKDGGVTYVAPGSDGTWSSLPQEVQKSIGKQLNEMNLRDDQDVQLLRVRSERGDGTSGEDYDYIICVSN